MQPGHYPLVMGFKMMVLCEHTGFDNARGDNRSIYDKNRASPLSRFWPE